MVVGSGLTPDWLRKRSRVLTALEGQLILGVEKPGKGLLIDQVQSLIEHRNPFVVPVEPAELAEVVALQQEKWHRVFPEKGSLDFSDLVVFPRRPGHDWPILVPKRMTNNRLCKACSDRFPCHFWEDDYNNVMPAQSFTTLRWFRKSQEPDEGLQNLSANMLVESGTPCVTLQERLWMEIDWFTETGDHLDRTFWTLVAGSRDQYGYVPYTTSSCMKGQFVVKVCQHSPNEASSVLYSRAAG